MRADHREAKKAGSWTAVSSLRNRLQSLRREYDEEMDRLRELAKLTTESRDLTMEERVIKADEVAKVISDLELDRFMMEWCRQHGIELWVDEDGETQVRPRLRVVG